MRLVRKSALLSVLLVVFLQGSALAATANVTMTEYVFTPKSSSINFGDSVKWTNGGTVAHTSTSNTPLSLWDSGSVPVGSTFTFAFTAGGKYQYHCTFHQSLGMTGTVSVKIKATPPSGPMGTIFTITVASIAAPTGFVYDIQMKKPGGSFQNWKPGTITKSVTWDSTGQPTGTYQFRSRLHNTSTNAASQYSAAKSIMVT